MKKMALISLALGLGFSLSARELGKIRVLTYNIWGVFIARNRQVRAEEIGKEIAKLNPDIIGFQEAFNKKHRQLILEGLERSGWGKPYQVYFKKWYGTGVWMVSRYPIEEKEVYHYPVNGYPLNSDFYARKGVGYIRVKTPFGPLDFFNTHMIARYRPTYIKGELVEEDRLKTDRLLQVEAISRFIQAENQASGVRSLVAVGDFNSPPILLEYQLLVGLSGLRNVVDEVGLKDCLSSKKICKPKQRIDHIFYQNYFSEAGFYLKPLWAKVVLDQPVETRKGKMLLSDHKGLLVEFAVLSPDDPEAKVSNRKEAEILLLEQSSELDLAQIEKDLARAKANPQELNWKLFCLLTLEKLNQKRARWNKIPTSCAKILTSKLKEEKLSEKDIKRFKKALKILQKN